MIQRPRRHAILAVCTVAFALGGSVATGDSLPTPQGQILLTVTGIEVSNSGEGAQFDLDMLMATGREEFETTTIWTDGAVTFTGVPLSALLDRLDITSGILEASALNEYFIEIPVEEVDEKAPIIAHHMNGALMSRRDKGPLWLVYPYDSDAKYRSEIVYARSVWQLDRIDVVQ